MIAGLDIYEPLPDKYVEKFDVVHLRLICAAIRDGDPLPILRNLLKMLSTSKEFRLLLSHSS